MTIWYTALYICYTATYLILSSSRSNTIQSIYHNVSNNDTVSVVLAPTTTTTITGATLGSTYTIEIKASNILGYGPTAMTEIGKLIVNIGGRISTYILTKYANNLILLFTPLLVPLCL